MTKHAPLRLFAGTASQQLGRKIATHYGQPLLPLPVRKFSDGECYPQLDAADVRDADVCLIQSTHPPVADHLMELLLSTDAALQAHAHSVTAIVPYLGYMRQDQAHHPGGPIGARLQAQLLAAAGISRLITCDVHKPASLHYFDFPVVHLSAEAIFTPHIQRLQLPRLTLIAPDAGAVPRAQSYAQRLGAPLVRCSKTRAAPAHPATVQVQGNVEDADAVIVDDMVDTGHTLCQTIAQLKAHGARTIHAYCTHPILSGPAHQRLQAAAPAKVIFTDTIPLRHPSSPQLRVCSIAPQLADALRQLHA